MKVIERPKKDLDAEERLGILTIRRIPKVIFTKIINLRNLKKRKPHIVQPDKEEIE